MYICSFTGVMSSVLVWTLSTSISLSSHQLNVPSMMCPAFNDLLRFRLMCSAEKVSELINLTVVTTSSCHGMGFFGKRFFFFRFYGFFFSDFVQHSACETGRFFNFSFQSFITPTLIHKFCLQLSVYRFIINKRKEEGDGTEDTSMFEQIEEVKCNVQKLSFVTILSPVRRSQFTSRVSTQRISHAYRKSEKDCMIRVVMANALKLLLNKLTLMPIHLLL